MNSKTATYISLFFITLLGVMYLISANNLSRTEGPVSLSPGFFPTILSTILIILCIISFFQTWKKNNNGKIKLYNVKLLFLTIITIIIFLLSWYYFNLFYFISFLFLFTLFTSHRTKQKGDKRFLFINASLALSVTLVLYALFDIIISIQL